MRLAIEVRWGVAIFFARHAPLRLVESAERRRLGERLEPQPYVPNATAGGVRYAIDSLGGGADPAVNEDWEWRRRAESGTMVIGLPRRGRRPR